MSEENDRKKAFFDFLTMAKEKYPNDADLAFSFLTMTQQDQEFRRIQEQLEEVKQDLKEMKELIKKDNNK